MIICDELGGRWEWMRWFGRRDGLRRAIENRYSLAMWLPASRVRIYGSERWWVLAATWLAIEDEDEP